MLFRTRRIPALIALVLSSALLFGCGGGGGGGDSGGGGGGGSGGSSGGNGGTGGTGGTPGGGTTTPPPDADHDGVPDSDDLLPNDPLCALASDIRNNTCLVRSLAGQSLKVVAGAQGKLFLTADDGHSLVLYGYDLNTRHFTGGATLQGYTPTSYAYVPAHGKVYVGASNGDVLAYSESLVANAARFAHLAVPVGNLASAGNSLVAQEEGVSWSVHHLFDKDGTLTQSKGSTYNSRFYEWEPVSKRLYFFRDGVSPNNLMFEEINQSTGTVASNGESPYNGNYSIAGPIRANRSGSKVLLGTGDVYAAPGLTWSTKIPTTISDALWLPDDQVLVVSGGNVHRYASDLALAEEIPQDGAVLGMALDAADKPYLIVKTASLLEFRAYVPNDDSDGDGVPNRSDRFPSDKAAAVDSDGDGYPDAWLPGRSAADSSTGLTLDAYPQDASCHAAGACDPALAVPTFVPDRIVHDGQGMVYLFGGNRDRLYRWSNATNGYVSPLVVGQASELPISIAYSAAHRRVYLGYFSGLITYIDIASSSPVERNFASAAGWVTRMAAVGQFVFAQDWTGGKTHYVFDQSGVLRDSRSNNYASSVYEWAPSQSRLYHFTDTSPGDLVYEEINQTTGRITAWGDTPYHGEYDLRAPIRVSPDGTRIVIGMGNIYSTASLLVTAQLGAPVTDMQWFDDGSLVTIVADGANTRWTTYTNGLSVRDSQVVVGEPLSVVRFGTVFVVFTRSGGNVLVNRVSL